MDGGKIFITGRPMRKILSCMAIFIIAIVLQERFVFAAPNLEEGVKILAEQISKSMIERQSKKIAIIDFSDLNGNVTDLGRFIAEELTTQLFTIASGKFEIMERRKLLKLEEELALSQTGFIEEKSIKKMGQVLGIDAIVTGTITDMGNTYRVNARLIGVESAKVFAVAATDISTEKKLPALEGKTSTPPQQPVQQIKAAAWGYIFEGKGCKDSGGIVTCVIAVTNKTDNEKALSVNATEGEVGPFTYQKTFLYDESGNEYQANNREGQWVFWMKRFMPNVPVNVRVSFEGMSIGRSKNVTLVIGCVDHRIDGRGIASSKEFSVTLRNVPVGNYSTEKGG